jgi:sn-glycerol 3-phosphate transport system permease protein
MKASSRFSKALQATPGHLLLVMLSFVAIFPLYWMFITALRAPNEVFSDIPWPQNPDFSNFRRLLSEIPFARMMTNTFVVSVASTILQVATAVLAAYSFARWESPVSRWLYALLTLTWLIPAQVVMMPNFILVSQLGLLDTLTALILPHAASAFAIMLLYPGFRAFPRELIEAAIIDGAGPWRILFYVMLPNIRAAIASLSILVFISIWNEYFWPLLVTRRIENSVIQIGLQMFFTSEGTMWGPLMSAASLASLPILLIYLVLQRQIVSSFVRSGLR